MLDILNDLAYAADTPGAYLRGVLGRRPGTRMSGREMLESLGLVNQDSGMLGDAAGMAANVVADPLNAIAFMLPLMSKLGSAGKSFYPPGPLAKALGESPAGMNAVEVADALGPAQREILDRAMYSLADKPALTEALSRMNDASAERALAAGIEEMPGGLTPEDYGRHLAERVANSPIGDAPMHEAPDWRRAFITEQPAIPGYGPQGALEDALMRRWFGSNPGADITAMFPESSRLLDEAGLGARVPPERLPVIDEVGLRPVRKNWRNKLTAAAGNLPYVGAISPFLARSPLMELLNSYGGALPSQPEEGLDF